MILAVVICFAIASIWLGVAYLGLVLACRGLRGRQVDQEARCRGCRYILTSLSPRPAVCPECGSKLASPADIHIGLRVRRPWPTTAGVVLILVALGSVSLVFLPAIGTAVTIPAAKPPAGPTTTVRAPYAGGQGAYSSGRKAGSSVVRLPGRNGRRPRSTIPSLAGGSNLASLTRQPPAFVPSSVAGFDPAIMAAPVAPGVGRGAGSPSPGSGIITPRDLASAERSSQFPSSAKIKPLDSPITEPAQLGGIALDPWQPSPKSGLANWTSGVDLILLRSPGGHSRGSRLPTESSGASRGAPAFTAYAGGYQPRFERYSSFAPRWSGQSRGDSRGPATLMYTDCRSGISQAIVPARSTGISRRANPGRIQPVSFK